MIMFDVMKIVHEYGYIGIGVISFLESGVFFMLPGDSLLFAAGLLASNSNANDFSVGTLNIYILLVLVSVTSTLGGLAGYVIGTYIDSLYKIKIIRKILSESRIHQAHLFFEKYGKFALLACRFVPLVRTFTPIVAGIAKMNKKTFVLYNTLGAIIWAFTLLLSSFWLGNMFPQIENYVTYIVFGIILVSVLPVIYKWLQIKMKK